MTKTPWPWRPAAFRAIGLAILGVLCLVWSTSAAPERTEAFEVELARMAEHFELHPELKNTKGSGWKPYNRAKWFHEQRLLDGVAPPPDSRWNAWMAKREIERRSGISPRATWFSLGPANFSGRILDIEFHPTDPNIVYVGSASGGLWKSTNNGASWIALEDELPTLAIGAVAVLPSDPNIVLIGTGEAAAGDVYGVGILKSTDAGLTWAMTDFVRPVEGNHGFHVMEVNATTGTILAGASDGLWRSTDDGDTWIDVRTGGDYYDVKWKPGDSMRVYTVKGSASSGNNVKVSTDDGVTWAKAGSGQPPSFLIGKSKIAVSADEPSWIYALYSENSSSGNTVGVYRSTDDGATWTLRNDTTNIAGGQGWYNLTLMADPNNAELVIGGGVQLRRSLDGGVFFVNVGGGVHVDHHAIAYEPGNPNTVWVGSDGGVWRSAFDGDGPTWSNRNNGLVTYQFYDICVNNGPNDYYIMGGTQDNGTDKWSGTTTWSEGLGADGMVCNINPVNGTTVYAEIQFGGHRKNGNSGAGNWSSIMSGLPTNNQQWVVPTAEDQLQGNHLYTHHSSGGIYRTLNGGGLWTNAASHSANWIDMHRLDGNITWTAGGSVWVTTDDGGTWTQAAPYGFSVGTATKILAHPTDLNSAFVTFSAYGEGLSHVALTTDLGATWTDVSGDFPSQPVNAIAVDPMEPTNWYIGTDVGVWTSTNGGTNWVPFEAGFPNVVVSDLEIQIAERKLVAGTYGRGAWEIDISSTGTGVDVAVDAGARNLMFDSPSPNPISERTLLRYAAKHDGPVTLGIYDVQGRLVSDLAEFARGDGIIRTTPWFPEDVASGVYFAVLRAGDAQKSHKLIVRK